MAFIRGKEMKTGKITNYENLLILKSMMLLEKCVV